VCFKNSYYPHSKHGSLSDASTSVKVKKKVELLCEKRDNPEICPENSWPSDFSRRRNPPDDISFVDSHKMVGFDGDDLGIFCMDYGNPFYSCEVEVIEEFCGHMDHEELVEGIGLAGCWRTVWLDDRGSPYLNGSGEARQYENPLTATGLYRALKQSRFHHEHLPDAARRLIYISDLAPACIHALAATISRHQIPVLRNAIYQHLTSQASITVKIPTYGFLTFQLDLHLPFFILRKSTPPEESTGGVKTKPPRRWTDLSFLKLNTSESQAQQPAEVWGIQEAQISFVVTGSSDWEWAAYAFVDAEVDGSPIEASESDLSFDQIVGSGHLDAHRPIWRPREYFLKVFEIRIEQVRMEWERLIHKVELGVNQYVRGRIQNPSNDNYNNNG
jgi:hypothetical protein